MASIADVSSRTIDYYTQLGLIQETERTSGNHRLYSEETIQTLEVIKKLREQRFSLIEICDILKNTKTDKTLEIALSIEKQLEDLEKKIIELQNCLLNCEQDEKAKMLSQSVLSRLLNTMTTLTMILNETPLIL
ncbi:MAG: MerR family transcriptional regulator [Bacillota bacterium]